MPEIQENEQIQEPKKKNSKELILQIIKFGIVGVINTIVSYVVYNFCYYVLGWPYHFCNLAGFIISVLNAWFLQSKFVFKESEDGEKRVWWKVLIKTYISYAFSGLFLTELLLIFWIDVVHLGNHLGGLCEWLAGIGMNFEPDDLAVSMAPLLNMVITIPLNFIINKFWAYRQKEKKIGSETESA